MDKWNAFLYVIASIAFLMISFTVAYTIAHDIAYKKGVEHSRLYYETTESFPSEAWIQYNQASHLYSGDDIRESLERYKSR